MRRLALKRLCLLALSLAVLLPLASCAAIKTTTVTATAHQTSTVTSVQTQAVPTTVGSTAAGPTVTSILTTTLTPPPLTTTQTVTAPPVTTTVTSTVAPPASTEPPSPFGILIANFSGSASQTNRIFVTTSTPFWIQYTFQRADPAIAPMAVAFTVYTQSGAPVRTVTSQQPASSTSYVYAPAGYYYIDITGTNAAWTLNVYQSI